MLFASVINSIFDKRKLYNKPKLGLAGYYIRFAYFEEKRKIFGNFLEKSWKNFVPLQAKLRNPIFEYSHAKHHNAVFVCTPR